MYSALDVFAASMLTLLFARLVSVDLDLNVRVNHDDFDETDDECQDEVKKEGQE